MAQRKIQATQLEAGIGGGSGEVTSASITDATATGRAVLTAASPSAARSAIGAGTSDLVVGTTATTAKAGDWVPSWADITGKPATFTPATHQHVAADITDLQSLLDAKLNLSGGTLTDGANIAVGTGTGTRIGTATTQKLGFFNVTPVVQQGATTDLGTALSNLGLRAAGTAYPITTSGNVSFTGNLTTSRTRIKSIGAMTATTTLTTSSAELQTADATTASFNVTLPATTTAGYHFTIKKIDTSANTVTILGTIDGVSTYVLTRQYESVTVVSTTTSGTWRIVHNARNPVSWGEVTGAPATYTPSTHTHVWADITDKPTMFTPSTHTHTASQISDATATGRSVLTATDAAAARTAIGAGTSSLALGTTSSTAKAGDYTPTWNEVSGKPTTFAPSTHSHVATDISDSTATGRSVLTAANATAARTAIGAGTSDLVLGTTSSTAKAGDYQPTWGQVTSKPTAFIPSAHVHPISEVTDLQTALDSKAPISHTHTAAQISDATTLGRDLIKAPDAAAARTLIGAGTGSSGGSLPPPIVTMSAGGQGDTVSNTSTAGAAAATNRGLRIPMTFFAKPKRFRFKVRNFNCTGYGPAGNAATGQGVSMGVHAGNFQFQGAQATTLVSGTYAISGTASFWFSDWITDPALMPDPGVEYLFATGYTQANTGTPNMAMQCGLNTNAAAAIAGANTTMTASWTPLDFQIEYEVDESVLRVLVVADSINEGITGPPGTSASNVVPQPLSTAPPNRWAASVGAVTQLHAVAGISTLNFVNIPDLFDRMNIEQLRPHIILWALGANDLMGSSTVSGADFVTNMGSALAIVRSRVGYGPRLYVNNVMPRGGITAAQQTSRTNFNAAIAARPHGAVAMIDMDSAMRNPASTNALLPALTNDTIHPSYEGQQVMADVYRNTLPSTPPALVTSPTMYPTMTQAQYDALGVSRDPNGIYPIRG